ncbi:MAG: HAD family phosphatase [Chitinophagales bacterium]|nr:HAD family phosphatase [Chitinophagales bacterium]
MPQYRNLVFDIGDVIIDIDYTSTVRAFQQLATVDFNEIVSYAKQHPIFDQFEKGQITAADFRNQLRQFLKPNTTDAQIDNAWNAILIHYPKIKLELLEQLKNKYRVFALSNINEIHICELDRVAQTQLGKTRFADLFHHAYYSNEIGHRKPEPDIYNYVVSQQNLLPHETFFVDDKAENVAAAKTLGWQAFQLTNRNELINLLQQQNIIT